MGVSDVERVVHLKSRKSPKAVEEIHTIMRDSPDAFARVEAAKAILDIGWGPVPVACPASVGVN